MKSMEFNPLHTGQGGILTPDSVSLSEVPAIGDSVWIEAGLAILDFTDILTCPRINSVGSSRQIYCDLGTLQFSQKAAAPGSIFTVAMGRDDGRGCAQQARPD
jgi:hypothetical protein